MHGLVCLFVWWNEGKRHRLLRVGSFVFVAPVWECPTINVILDLVQNFNLTSSHSLSLKRIRVLRLGIACTFLL